MSEIMSMSKSKIDSRFMVALEGNRLVDEHDRDIFPERVHEFLVFAHQSAVDFFLDELAGAVFQLPGGDLLVESLDQRRLRDRDRLMRFRATHDFQQFRIDHKSLKNDE